MTLSGSKLQGQCSQDEGFAPSGWHDCAERRLAFRLRPAWAAPAPSALVNAALKSAALIIGRAQPQSRNAGTHPVADPKQDPRRVLLLLDANAALNPRARCWLADIFLQRLFSASMPSPGPQEQKGGDISSRNRGLCDAPLTSSRSMCRRWSSHDSRAAGGSCAFGTGFTHDGSTSRAHCAHGPRRRCTRHAAWCACSLCSPCMRSTPRRLSRFGLRCLRASRRHACNLTACAWFGWRGRRARRAASGSRSRALPCRCSRSPRPSPTAARTATRLGWTWRSRRFVRCAAHAWPRSRDSRTLRKFAGWGGSCGRTSRRSRSRHSVLA